MIQSLIHFSNIDDDEIPPSGIYLENHRRKIAIFQQFIPTIKEGEKIIYSGKEYQAIKPKIGWQYVQV